MIKKTAVIISLVAMLMFGLVSTSFAAGNPNGTGQPSQSCQAEPMTPGHAANARGSAFNPTGVAGAHYAGTQPQNSNNPHSVAQYDVACYHVSQNHP